MEHILKTASRFGKVYGIIGVHATKPESLKKPEFDLSNPLHSI